MAGNRKMHEIVKGINDVGEDKIFGQMTQGWTTDRTCQWLKVGKRAFYKWLRSEPAARIGIMLPGRFGPTILQRRRSRSLTQPRILLMPLSESCESIRENGLQPAPILTTGVTVALHW